MKRFLLYTTLFLAIVALVDFLFGIVMKGILTETEKGDWGRNNFIFNEVTADAIILGSSRAIHHYDPRVISDSLGMNCYNCGEDGMGILLMYARYRAIRERSIPKIVIYEVMPKFDLQVERDNQKYLKFLRPYSNIQAIDSIVCSISSTEKCKLSSQMYRYNSVFVDIVSHRFSKVPRTATNYTYSPLDKQKSYEPAIASNNKTIPCDSVKITYLEELIVQCKKNGTTLVFTASPMYKATSDMSFKPLKSLCKKYHIPFINHYCDTAFSSNRLFWADARHLNKIGAEQLSVVVATEIKKEFSK